MSSAEQESKSCPNEDQMRLLQEQSLLTDVRLAAYEQEFSYQRTLLYDPRFTPTQKILIFILREMMQSMHVNRLTLTKREMDRIERGTMIKEARIRGCLNELKELGTIQYKVNMGPPSPGGHRASQYVISFQTAANSAPE